MIEFLLILILIGGFFIFRTLSELLKDVKIMRTHQELPSQARKSYDEEMNKIDTEIESAFALMMVTPKGDAEEARKAEFKELVNKRVELLDRFRKHFVIRSEYLK